MKVLLVYPIFPDTYWSFRYALEFEGKKAAFPPLGLLTIASMLPTDWERRLVDMNIEDLTTEDLEWADMVFASAMIVQKESLEDVVERARNWGRRWSLAGRMYLRAPKRCRMPIISSSVRPRTLFPNS
jgi:hypothetical protein